MIIQPWWANGGLASGEWRVVSGKWRVGEWESPTCRGVVLACRVPEQACDEPSRVVRESDQESFSA